MSHLLTVLWMRGLGLHRNTVWLCVYITCCLVSADIKQASAPVPSSLSDGGDGGFGDAKAGLRHYWFQRSRGFV